MQNTGTCCLKKCFNKERSKGIFVPEKSNENALNSKDFLMHYKVHPNSFSHYKVDQKKTVAISQMYNHVQLHVHWMHLLINRICRYTYSINTTLL